MFSHGRGHRFEPCTAHHAIPYVSPRHHSPLFLLLLLPALCPILPACSYPQALEKDLSKMSEVSQRPSKSLLDHANLAFS